MRTLAGNLAKIGAVAAVGLGVAVRGGLESLATLESAVTSLDGAIGQLGLAGKVSGSQVAGWANEIEASVEAAFDDKAIATATATLIRFGKVTPGNLRPSMEVMTDLAAKTGDVDSAASLLAKALADPAKAAGKLAKQGVILTAAEQKKIKALMKAGKTAQAQKVILDSLAKTTKGAAAAMNGPYKDALNTLEDVTEDAQRALAEGFLPVIQRVAKWLSTSLADPKVMADIRRLGDTLADAFDQGVSFVQRIPWGTVKEAMLIVGNAAKMALDAFTSMPAWVQTAVISGWGLNKLSGGALGDIVGELAKGLVKGDLGINAGVVNINAGVVNGGGGVPGKGGGGLGGKIGAGLGITGAAGAAAVGGATVALGAGALAAFYGIPAAVAAIAGAPKPEANVDKTGRDTTNILNRWNSSLTPALTTLAAEQRNVVAATKATTTATRGMPSMIRAQLAPELRDSRPPSVTSDVTVNVKVSAADVGRSVTIRRRYGSSSGSRATGDYRGPR
jgi:hypothetical protein